MATGYNADNAAANFINERGLQCGNLYNIDFERLVEFAMVRAFARTGFLADWNSVFLNAFPSGVFTVPASGNTSFPAASKFRTVYIPQQTANNVVTLGAVATMGGMNAKFIVAATANGANTLTITSPTAVIQGRSCYFSESVR